LVLRLSEPRFAAALAAGIAGLLLLVQGDDRDRSEPAAGPVGTIASLRESGPREVRTGVVSGATPPGAHTVYASSPATPRARLNELARQLRGAGHPFSPSMAAHLEAQPTIALVDWQP
jgi:hypothetical protein